MTIHSNGSEDPDCTIPVIDLSQKDDVVAKELVHAFSAIGFATLINHNVEQTTIEKGFAASKSFFNLPAEAKLQCEYQSHLSNRGYIKMGSESHETQPDQKETFDIGKEGEVGLETPWPSMLPSFKDDLLHYFKEFDLLNLRLMKLLAIGLQLADVNFFVDRCNQKHCNLRLLHYPELKREVNDTVIVRGASHTDFGSITLLSQDMIGGLRVKQRNGRWASVTPVKGSIIVNVGEMMQRWTNDVLCATPHQVVDHSSHTETIPERYSIAFFCNANKDVVLDSSELSSELYLIGGSEPEKYPPINSSEYLTKRLGDTIVT